MKRSDSKSYYSAHRSEILSRATIKHKANPDLYRERTRLWRERNPKLNSERQIGYFRKWRSSHRDKHRAIKNAQQTVPLGSCCEFCGSVRDLMRFHPDYDYPLIVVTVCRECRGWTRS